MELKDMILSTLKELDEAVQKEEKPAPAPTTSSSILQPPLRHQQEVTTVHHYEENVVSHESVTEEVLSFPVDEPKESSLEDEESGDMHQQFYRNLRERVLVLFEGFQSPNNKNIEAKVDLTLNFLEYLLATIDEQLERMERPKA